MGALLVAVVGLSSVMQSKNKSQIGDARRNDPPGPESLSFKIAEFGGLLLSDLLLFWS